MRKGMTLQFKVTNQTIERLDSNKVYANSREYLYAKFIFSEDWQGYTKTVKFSNVLTDSYCGVTLGNEQTCLVPLTVILFPAFTLCIEGIKDESLITTNSVVIDVETSHSADEYTNCPISTIESTNLLVNKITHTCEINLNLSDDFRVDSETKELTVNFDPINQEIDDLRDSVYTQEETLQQIDEHKLINKTYDELATLKANNELVAGQQYRITDYVTTTNGTINNVANLSRSVGHPFDIVVEATSTNTFSEDAKALMHSGDNYFANCKLTAWKLCYCFDNDTDRFEWADTTNGKGVIYRMIDEFGNNIPYDFKNIQFKRYKITGTTDDRQSAFIGKYYAFNGSYGVTYDANDFNWYYTCCDTNGNDLSIQNVNDHNWDNCRYTKEVKIDEYLSDEPTYRGKKALNDIVLISPTIIVDMKFGEGSNKNTLIGNEDMTYSYFKEMCRRNIICGELSHNRCDECFQDNIIGTGVNTDETFHFVRTGRHFENNIIIKMASTTFQDAAYDNVFANVVQSCSFTSIINKNDYKNLNLMQYCDIQRSYNTKLYGSGNWLYVKVKGFESCEVHIDNLYGSSFGFLQKVTLSKNEGATISILSMDFETILGPTSINLSDLVPYNLSGSRSFKKLCGARVDNTNGNRFEYICENIEDGMPKVLGAYSNDNGATWKKLDMPDNCYVVTLDDLTIPSEYNPGAGNMTFGWSSSEKIVFSESLAKVIKETKRPIVINYSILHTLCPKYYSEDYSYDYVVFYPSASKCYKEAIDVFYDVDELISYESKEVTQNLLGTIINTTYKINFDFLQRIEGEVPNPKEAMANVYDAMLFFERTLKAKQLYDILSVQYSDFEKLKYDGSVTISANINLYNLGANEIMGGITVYEPDGTIDLDTLITFERTTGMINLYSTPVLLFYNFYARADYVCSESDAYVIITRMDKPTYTLSLTNFERVAQDDTVNGWDAIYGEKIEFVLEKEQLDNIVTKISTMITNYFPTIDRPQNMYDVVGVLNKLFDVSQGYASTSSPTIPVALCQLIASARSVTDISVTGSRVVSHNIQVSCNLNNEIMTLICFSDAVGTLGGDTLIEDATHYYRLNGHWDIS